MPDKDKKDTRHKHESHTKHEKHGKHEHEKHGSSGSSQVTTDHETIRKWVEQRGGSPATVASTMRGDDPGMLRIDFPGYSGEQRLEHIEWDEWFEKFDEKGLKFLYQDEMKSGQPSRFWKLVYEAGEERERKAS